VTEPVFLSPGEMRCRTDAAVVSTILGSCVAVCLWDKQRRFGGINHYLLPRRGVAPPSLRYGDVALFRLSREMESLGCREADLRAKVFGGAAVLPYGSRAETVGAQNVSVALETLRYLGIPVLARRTGGERGLFIRFNTGTGRVLVRELAASARSSANALAAILARG
jgi:chemotaxis protein CheD